MEDPEYVCPLCCEELDLSDRQFYPCKCGYQVCMWCWHRIRESESGLCPACRTPYGDDPHEFSAVDVEEVLKANKEKAAAEKRERLKQQQQHETESDGEGVTSTGSMEPPKDRSQLINMRVIRRNLVYAVGLPVSLANEDTLRKPEYFGQYGKISKIVLNRNNITGNDPRRSSTSAYVTFVHKEDTLACILALDGFFLDGRNIRASYGTSKYCSAFIKNVRCNNPDCTYLHGMGEPEDTFTKQEIQAGYVTSGRDVLARQQQIVAKALSAASAGAGTRRKVGGGGPSGTGKACSNPVFPQPAFDEPLKPSTINALVPPPAPIASRSVSTGTGVPTVGESGTMPVGKIGRSVSMTESSTGAAIAAASVRASSGTVGATAASVVAGVHTMSNTSDPPAPHTTLTPLTPLKRVSQVKGSKPSVVPIGPSSSIDNDSAVARKQGELSMKLNALRSNNASLKVTSGTAATSPASSNASSIAFIGGTVIGAPMGSATGGAGAIGATVGGRGSYGVIGGGSGSLGGQAIGGSDLGVGSSSSLGGEVFTGQLPPSGPSAIGSQKDRWAAAGGGRRDSTGSLGMSSSGLWGNETAAPAPIGRPISAAPGGRPIGSGAPGPIGGAGLSAGHNSGSSALASMLGISLPTGSGSLRDSSNLMPSQSGSFGGSSVGAGVIGSGHKGSHAPIGGLAIGSSSSSSFGMGASNPQPIGGANNQSDIALLQSLLPGVHITSGNAQQPAAPSTSGGGWNPMSVQTNNGGMESWGGNPNPGGIFRQNGNQPRQEQGQSSIW